VSGTHDSSLPFGPSAGGHTPHATAESSQAARRIAAAKPTSALPTSIIAASSLNHGACRGTDGTATVAVIVVPVVSVSLVDPTVGVTAATSPRNTNVKHRLRIRSSLIPRFRDRTSVPVSLLTEVQVVCHATAEPECE
jgi:hypothetical protein